MFGGEQDDVASAMLVDAQGDAYLIGETRSFYDKTYNDFLIVKVKAGGSLAWARTYGTPDAEHISNYLDGTHGGSARAAALGADGSVYVTGSSMVSGRRDPVAAIVFKITPDGDLAWSRIWRPGWENMAKFSAAGSCVTVSGNRVFVAGQTGAGLTNEEGMIFLASFDAATGEQTAVVASDPNPTVNDRVFSMVADENGVWLAGWNGKTNRGQLTRFSTTNDNLALDWSRQIPLQNLGSTLADIDRDAAGNLYLAADIHGTETWIEILKLGPDGSFKWGRRYNAGASNDKNNTRTIRVLGDKLVVGGRVGLGGAPTEADRNYGDSLLLVYTLEGKLVRELYHFTGTANDVVAMDAVTGIGAFGKTLYAGGWIWPHGKNHVGEWRDPNGYRVSHASAETNASDYAPMNDVHASAIDLPKAASRKGEEFKTLGWKDVTAAMSFGTPKEQSTKGHQTQFYLFTFDGLL